MYVPPLMEALGLCELEHQPEEQSDAGEFAFAANWINGLATPPAHPAAPARAFRDFLLERRSLDSD